jgi:hypothetical protein
MRSTKNDDLRNAGLGPADLMLQAYRQLRPGRPAWQRVTEAIAGPAIRLHRLRNTSTRLWRGAICDLDCSSERHERL